ncbi:Tripartite motif-containing protein 58 [Heterocephalus glaber]|uniref:Tripartite motif-containing protein 58 n=1 Tax=Heterocephalus glaber TaxID=10181 RepID=G5C439_HETGA|nr:Tripartite motif-containing protein 58 [Heterocephalus glaber]
MVEGMQGLALAKGATGASEGAGCTLQGQKLQLFCRQDRCAVQGLLSQGGTPGTSHHPSAGGREAAQGEGQGQGGRWGRAGGMGNASLCPSEHVKLQQALEMVQKEMEEASTQEVNVGKKTVVRKEKVEMQQQRFWLEFQKYHGFLALEERLQLRGLEEEERVTLQRLRDSRVRLAQHSKALKELVEELDQRSQHPALGLLEMSRERRWCVGAVAAEQCLVPGAGLSLCTTTVLSWPYPAGLFRDCNAWKDSCYDPCGGSHIYTFGHLFPGCLWPYFFVCDKNPLVLPQVAEVEWESRACRAPQSLGAEGADGPELPS